MKQYIGNYLAIVVQNNDPETRGRVKVWVPHISATLYSSWNQTFQGLSDKHFVFPDAKSNPDLINVMQKLKEFLPWAETAMPIFGGGASGQYFAYDKVGTTSDSSTAEIGFRPAQNYTGQNRVADAFSSSGINTLVNPHSCQFVPSDYSNLARGSFNIPNVGAHVWVFFINGDVNYPVVFATSYGQEDWKRIYTLNKTTGTPDSSFVSPDYPSSCENLSKEDNGVQNHDTETFRSKHVFNSNKNVIELIDTDNAEILKVTHFSGSFLEFNNFTSSLFSTNNHQQLTIGSEFKTVRKNAGLYIGGNSENIIMGDFVRKIGNVPTRTSIAQQILSILRGIHEYKLLFETCRCDAIAGLTSAKQHRAGAPASCPVCSGTGVKFDWPCHTCTGTGLSPASQDGLYGVDPLKSDLIDLMKQSQHSLFAHEASFGNGGDDISNITGNKVTVIGTVFNDLQSYRVDPTGKLRNSSVMIAPGGVYMAMQSTPLVEYVDVDSTPGGDWNVTVGNKYTLNVGSKGIHIKTTGPVNLYGTVMNIAAEQMNISSTQEMIIDGGERLELRGSVITLTPDGKCRSVANANGKLRSADKVVAVNGNLGVKGNIVSVGGAYHEGELYVQHMTAPDFQYTTEVSCAPFPHSHVFHAPPWRLMGAGETNEVQGKLVRTAASSLNFDTPVPNLYCPGFWIPT